MATTIDTWQDEIRGFFDTRAPNAPTESANVKIKSIRRAARAWVEQNVERRGRPILTSGGV